MFTLKEMERQTDDQVVILKTSQCKVDFGQDKLILDFETVNLVDWFKSIYHLASSHKVFVDNYYGFLSVTNFKQNVQCIQLWHAAGAIKQFALKDPSVTDRSYHAYKRFKAVYNRFNQVVVGSEYMAFIFQQSFDIDNDRILRTGVPRTDFFYDSFAKLEAEKKLQSEFPTISDKKVILYAPTYRDNELNITSLQMDIDKMYQEFKHEYVLMLRLHPAVNGDFQNKYPNFIFNVSSYHNINHLLVITDILISDYSSIPFEFSLLNKPMIFFAYDLEDYSLARGFWGSYEDLVPGPIVENNEDLIDVIRSSNFNVNKIRQFAKTWNQYSLGNSSKNLVNSIYGEVDEVKKVAKANVQS